MTAVVYQIRDYQSPKDIERMREALEKQAVQIMTEVIPYGGTGIDGMPWLPTDGPLSGYKDPA